MNVMEELEKFVVNELAVEQDKKSITPDEDLLMQGVIDSMGVLKLSSFIEEKFGIKVTDIDMVPENFQNLEKLTEFISSKM
jgi:acyl carrier protein